MEGYDSLPYRRIPYNLKLGKADMSLDVGARL